MKFQNVLFNGGMITKISDHLLEPTQAVDCVNIDTERGSIFPLNNWTLVDTISGMYASTYRGATVANSVLDDRRSYVYFANRLYYTNGTYGSYGLMRIDATYNSTNATAPTVISYGTITSTATNDGLLNGTYAYAYTVIDEDGIESAPSVIYTTSVTDKQIDISISADTVNETVTKRRLYRTGGSNPTFNLIAEIDDLVAPYTYTDNTSDLNVSRIELTTFSDYAPPADIDNLVENNGTFFASLGNRVYFSRSGQPEYWGALDFIVLHAECTGLGIFRDSVVAFTDNDAYVINGYSRDDISLERLPFQEGCISHHSIATLENMLVWTSNNGVCVYNGSDIHVITRNLLEWKSSILVDEFTFDSLDASFDSNLGDSIMFGLGVRGKYYGVSTNKMYILDIARGTIISVVELAGIQSVFYNEVENQIEAVILMEDTDNDYKSYVFDTDDELMQGRWKSGRLGGQEGYGVIKDYRKIIFDNTPDYVNVYIDGSHKLYLENNKEFHLPSGSIGHSLQFELGTTKEIRSVKVEYGVMR